MIVPATGHTNGEVVIENEKAATCTEDGSYDEVIYCTVCGEEVSRETVIVPATGHDFENGECVGFEWSEDGTSAKAIVKCADCDETEEFDATMSEEKTPATCTEAGKTVYTATYGENSDSNEVVIPALGHHYSKFIGMIYDADGNPESALLQCGECGTMEIAAAEITTEVVDATCTEAGYTLYTVTYGDETMTLKTAGKAALGHAYGDPVMVWEDDLSAASAVITCANDNAHTETYDAVVSKTLVAGEDGASAQIEYAATAQIGDETFTDYKYTAIEIIPRHSIEMNGLLLLNFYYNISEEDAASYDIQVVFKKGDEVCATVPFAEAKQNSDLYGFSCPIDSDEMTTAITAELYYDDVLVNVHDYKLTDYSGTPATRNLLYAMKSYGAASQLYFGTNVDDLADAGLEGEYERSEGVRDISEMLADESIVPVKSDEVNAKLIAAGIEDIAYRGASISLQHGIVIRYYFTSENIEAAYEKYQGLIGFTNADAELQMTEDGSMLYIESEPISTTEVNNAGANGLVVDGTTVQDEYTANMYIKNNINKAGLTDVLTWLYYFCAEAEAY